MGTQKRAGLTNDLAATPEFPRGLSYVFKFMVHIGVKTHDSMQNYAQL